MERCEKQVGYQATNTYSTLNTLSGTTENIWLVFHGIGYLSRYFLKYFNELPPERHYVIAPQAPAKYYLSDQYRHVGASWLTKENTQMEVNNVLNYVDEVVRAETFPQSCKRIVFGFSQGVSVAMRWLALRRPVCDHLVLYAGGIPKELQPAHFQYLEKSGMKMTVLCGTEDEFISPERYKQELSRLRNLFPVPVNAITFEGGHEIHKTLLNELEP